MRGNISLLGNVDVLYILTDSPLTVQDRLGSLVTFTSFSDTTTVVRQGSADSFFRRSGHGYDGSY